MLRAFNTYDDELMGFFPVIARPFNTNAPRHIQVDSSYVSATPTESLGRASNKVIAPGFFAGSIPGQANKYRILPRTVAAANLAASGTSLQVKFNTSAIFVPGDILSIIASSVRQNIQSASGGWAVGDTITTTVNGISVVYTVVAGDIGGSLAATNQLVADKVLAAVKASTYLSDKVDGKTIAGASGSVDAVYWASNFNSLFTFATSDSATNGTVTASAATFAPNTVVGTVSAVNTATNVLTISAASVSVPLGVPIGVSASLPHDLGMLSPSQPMDLVWRPNQHYAAYVDIFVYKDRLPYWDGQLANLFPGINLV